MPRFAKIVTLPELSICLPFSPPFFNYMQAAVTLEPDPRKRAALNSAALDIPVLGQMLLTTISLFPFSQPVYKLRVTLDI